MTRAGRRSAARRGPRARGAAARTARWATGMPLASSAGAVMTVFLVAVLVLGYVMLWATALRVPRPRPGAHPDPAALGAAAFLSRR